MLHMLNTVIVCLRAASDVVEMKSYYYNDEYKYVLFVKASFTREEGEWG